MLDVTLYFREHAQKRYGRALTEENVDHIKVDDETRQLMIIDKDRFVETYSLDDVSSIAFYRHK